MFLLRSLRYVEVFQRMICVLDHRGAPLFKFFLSGTDKAQTFYNNNNKCHSWLAQGGYEVEFLPIYIIVILVVPRGFSSAFSITLFIYKGF